MKRNGEEVLLTDEQALGVLELGADAASLSFEIRLSDGSWPKGGGGTG